MVKLYHVCLKPVPELVCVPCAVCGPTNLPNYHLLPVVVPPTPQPGFQEFSSDKDAVHHCLALAHGGLRGFL